jgi:AraC-like DNA-binding protein
LEVGFADQPAFNRSFREIVGTSPGRWRRANASMPKAFNLPTPEEKQRSSLAFPTRYSPTETPKCGTFIQDKD